MDLALAFAAIVLGFVALVWGADRFVEGSAALARSLGVSPLIIGLTIVGFGTSAPELLVSAIAAHEGAADLSVGNAIGSNITNVACVLGVTSLIAPLTVHSKVIARELPVLFLVMVLGYALLSDGELSRLDGGILLTGLFLLVGWIVVEGLRDRDTGDKDALAEEFAAELPEGMGLGKAALWVGVGLLVLLGSARLVVWGATEIALRFGVSELVIGLTVVAVGTSLPELAASIVSALKKEHDIAIGNVIGSNMFNLLGVLALPGLIAPGPVSESVLVRDYPVMAGVTVLLFVMARGLRVRSIVTRLEGGILLACFVAYIGVLFWQSGAGP